jgi:GNAT superfamily N-acetyltransferase
MGARTETKQEHRTLTLDDGTVFTVRTIRPDDASALQRFHGRLSERSIYLRFFGSIKELSDEKARYFAHTDSADHFALVALDPDEPDEIIAVTRYDREAGSDRAEYAALVEDPWQGRGVGVGLTHRLVDTARDRGVRRFYALVMKGNRGMLKLLRSLDLPERERREGNDKYVEVEL